MQAYWLDDGDTATIDSETLAANGIPTEQLSIDPSEHQGRLDELRGARGYHTQDEVALSPATENLDALCAKFIDEHLHDDDEVRFVLEGDGIFDIRSNDDRWMRVVVEAGDLIIVPAGKYHRFMLTDSKQIRCVRLFKDASGWTPVYR
jgi:1,2-dihydroxy-3-keto-5-methylthiopentene dioxygenase